MKKLSIVAVIAIAAATMVGCGNSTPKANLKTDVDTLSYAIGMAQTQGLLPYLAQNEVDTTNLDEFIKGVNDGINVGDDKNKAAYLLGLQIGQQISKQMLPGINHQVFGEDTTKTVSLENFVAGFIDGAAKNKSWLTQQTATELAQKKMQAIQAAAAEKQFGANKKAGEKFLASKAKEGYTKIAVKAPNGQNSYILVKEIKAGSGEKPTATSSVKVNYEGKTIDGKVFDSSYKRGEPVTMGVGQVIPGFTAALENMTVGSKYEVVIPQELAYGERQMGEDIKPFSALCFTIELLSIEQPAQQAQPITNAQPIQVK